MNCIIIDDEAASRSILYKLCSKVNDLFVEDEFENPTDALVFLELKKVDFIFLDLHMPMLNGFDFIDVLKDPPKIILTTIDRESAIKAFEYKCIVDYLGKPFEFPRFINALDKVTRAIKITNQSQTIGDYDLEDIFINVNKKLVKIALNDIDFIKTDSKGIKLCTNNKTYIVKSSLNKISDNLPKSLFLRVHQSFIINISKIIDIKNGHVLINDVRIPISRSRKSELLGRINLF
ncbi:LytTR family two component transcriptional regulator [Flavobacteriaceae bacterium MAR_2010_72]|nr:LytTR family two component transcriptional regulator [Flavobacteriaceae bacterium MAR_2010_72]